MIRHQISAAELRKRIHTQDGTWYQRSKKLLKSLPQNPTSKQFKSLWGDIKPVYMTLQGSKCIYCESMIEGRISNDVEHFRPKAKVSNWKLPKKFQAEGIVLATPSTPKGDLGYRDLAYEPWNYAASCKVCNSVLKKNYFPITGKRRTTAKNPRTMSKERALFIYPIGDFDDNPADLIRFSGMNPEPAAKKGTHAYHRGLVTIEAFQLNDADKRKELFRARAVLLRGLYSELEKISDSGRPAMEREEAKRWKKIYLQTTSPHTNCLTCFDRAFQTDPFRARDLITEAEQFLSNRS